MNYVNITFGQFNWTDTIYGMHKKVMDIWIIDFAQFCSDIYLNLFKFSI